MNTSMYDSRTQRENRNFPVAPVSMHARYFGLQSAVDRLRSTGSALSAPVEIVEWNGAARHGHFVQIDATTWALHTGRGHYITVDIQRDLNGVTPSEATNSMLCRSGAVHQPDTHESYNPARYASRVSY